jgi:hypothetical protein
MMMGDVFTGCNNLEEEEDDAEPDPEPEQESAMLTIE